jgi:hypothetical protein
MLLLAGASPPPADVTAGSDGKDSSVPASSSVSASPVSVIPDATSPATTSPSATSPATTSPAVEGPAVTHPAGPPAAGSDDACLPDPECIDRYLWSLYQRTPKTDTVNVSSQTKATVKRKGKTKTVTRTVTKAVGEDFAWKDPKAAEVAGMELMDYVIGGMDPGFRVALYVALRKLDGAGFKPGIMCAFRDDYRQSIATGLKAQNDRSWHGGSLRGGYGHGMAADIVSVRGETRTERLASTSDMWAYIDKHEKDLGIGRPYLDRDPPHVGPVDGQEYADHRLKAKVQHAGVAVRKSQARAQAKSQAKVQAKTQAKIQTKSTQTKITQAKIKDRSHDLAVHGDHDIVKRTKVTSPAKAPAKARTPAI